MRSTTRRKVFTCPKCGIPNMEGDRKCMYCGTRFTGLRAMFTFIISRIKKNRQSVSFDFKGRGSAVLLVKKIAGLCLILAGLFLFAKALMDGKFKDWIIAVILLGYGSVLIKAAR